MSLADIEEFARELPYALREQVVDYVRSVREAAPDIAREAGVRLESSLVDELMWVAATKRLYWILNSAFWTIDTANRLLREHDAGVPIVGLTDYSRESSIFAGLRYGLRDFEALLRSLEFMDLVRLPWADVLRRLADGRQGR